MISALPYLGLHFLVINYLQDFLIHFKTTFPRLLFSIIFCNQNSSQTLSIEFWCSSSPYFCISNFRFELVNDLPYAIWQNLLTSFPFTCIYFFTGIIPFRLFFLRYFFSTWVLFHEHSWFTGQQGKGEAVSLTPFYNFHPLQRHLNINRTITAKRPLLHIASSRTKTGNIWGQ